MKSTNARWGFSNADKRIRTQANFFLEIDLT